VDGDPDTLWNAGAGPPAWIEIDLGEAMAPSLIRLYVAQSPEGATEHRVYGRADAGGAATLLGTLAGATADHQVLELNSAGWPAVRFVRIETVTSPSWVAWREIEIEGE
jgi:F5/8 type C domain-containing protein